VDVRSIRVIILDDKHLEYGLAGGEADEGRTRGVCRLPAARQLERSHGRAGRYSLHAPSEIPSLSRGWLTHALFNAPLFDLSADRAASIGATSRPYVRASRDPSRRFDALEHLVRYGIKRTWQAICWASLWVHGRAICYRPRRNFTADQTKRTAMQPHKGLPSVRMQPLHIWRKALQNTA
jgi:hypothetical protein